MREGILRRMRECVEEGRCPFCERKINFQEFEDLDSLLRFDKTKVCSDCQNSFLYDLRNFQRETS